MSETLRRNYSQRFFEHYYNVKESSASTHICSYSSALRLKPEGVSNAADAMAAIEKFVFEEEMVHCRSWWRS